jgi:hypothetical protein
MPLSEWDKHVAPHLRRIEDYSRAVADAANALPVRPAFDTKAVHELMRAERVLADALANVRNARAAYNSKQTEAA